MNPSYSIPEIIEMVKYFDRAGMDLLAMTVQEDQSLYDPLDYFIVKQLIFIGYSIVQQRELAEIEK